jgi:diguanylate cyclase (GGDEF)-like protein
MKTSYDHLSREELVALLLKRDKEIELLQKHKQILSKDELTDTYNRNSGLDMINRKLNRNNNIIIALIDMNNLKKINDTHGHVEGDNAIKVMVDIIEDNIDSRRDFIVRIGGDEFLIVFGSSTLIEARRKLAKSKSILMKSHNKYEFPITFSAGLIDCNKHKGKSIKEIIETVDKTMYKNKKVMKQRMGIENYR